MKKRWYYGVLVGLTMLGSISHVAAEESQEVTELKIQIEAKKRALKELEEELERLTGEKYSTKLTEKELQALKFHIDIEDSKIEAETNDDVLVAALTLGFGERYLVRYDEEHKTVLLFPNDADTLETAVLAVENGPKSFDYKIVEWTLEMLWEGLTEFVTTEHRIAIVNPDAVQDNKTEYTFADFIVTMKNGELEYSMFQSAE